MESRRILIVDDSDEVREFFEAVLAHAGYRVETAASGEAALARLESDRPDLIVLDVVMPGMDGLELLLKLRSDLAPPVPPAILVSGFDMTAEEAMRRGALRFLPKPVEARDLIAAVHDALNGRRAAADTVAAAEARTSAARLQARETAARLMRQLEAQTPPGQPFPQHAASLVSFVARYLHVDAVVAAVLRGDRLSVLASSSARLPPGADFAAALPTVEKVLESGSSLVLPDLPIHPTFSWLTDRIDQMRCLIAVPIDYEGSAVGVLCVLHHCACALAGEDLALVQRFSARGTALLRAWVAGHLQDELPFRLGPGVAPTRAFERALELELRLLQLRGGSLELAIASAGDLAPVYQTVAHAADPERLMAGVLASGRVALYKRDRDLGARTHLAAVLEELREHGEADSVGVVDLTAGALSSLHAETLLRLAEQALDEALESSSPVRRLVVAGETA